MTAQLLIDQAGLPAGIPGQSRSDGKLDGSVITFTSFGAGAVHALDMLWQPDGDTAPLVQIAPTVWELTPTPNCPGTYRMQLTVDGDVQRRVFRVRTATLRQVVPALNEIADARASLLNQGAPVIDVSEDNEVEPGTAMPPGLTNTGPATQAARFPAGSFAGWYPGLSRDLPVKLDDLAAADRPTGFVNRTDSEMSFSNNRIFNIEPFAGGPGYYDIFLSGRRVRKDQSEQIAIPNVDGVYWFYFDPTTAVLSVVADPSEEFTAILMQLACLCAIVVWQVDGA